MIRPTLFSQRCDDTAERVLMTMEQRMIKSARETVIRADVLVRCAPEGSRQQRLAQRILDQLAS